MVIAPCAWSATGISEPSGSSGPTRPWVIALPKIRAVIDFAIDQLWKVVCALTAASRSDATRHPYRYTRTAAAWLVVA